jgi:Uma2 family endonuclease
MATGRCGVTALDDRPQARDHAQMQVETFELLAADAERAEEGLRLEFIGGKVGVKAVADNVHALMVMWLIRQCIQQRQDLDLLSGLGLKIETYRDGRAIPDGVLVPADHFAGAPREKWVKSDGVLMTVEVTSWDRDTTQRDRIDKPRAYAESGIPVYLLIDRDTREVTVYSTPEGGAYRHRQVAFFGEAVSIPEPVGIELDTQRFVDLMKQAEG